MPYLTSDKIKDANEEWLQKSSIDGLKFWLRQLQFLVTQEGKTTMGGVSGDQMIKRICEELERRHKSLAALIKIRINEPY